MSRGLAGIRIDVASPPLTEVLPRMDVAVFVGFAATGPTHRPVAVESVAQYAAIFGPDAPLAWDGEQSERVYANLGASVRAFFSNGGRRCWVIRVARTRAFEAARQGRPATDIDAADVASTNRFAMSGVLVLRQTGLAPALAQARSLGSWSDPLRLSTALVASAFTLTGCSMLSGSRIGFDTARPLRPGDLIELDDAAATSVAAARMFATVDRVAEGGAGRLRRVEAILCAAFEPSLGDSTSPPSLGGGVDIVGITEGAAAATLAAGAPSTARMRLSFAAALPDGLCAGYWARWSGTSMVVWLRIDDVDPAARTVEGMAWREAPASLPVPAPIRAAVLTLDLRVAADPDRELRLHGVGLTSAQTTSWWDLAGDEVVRAARRDLDAAAPPISAGFPLVAPDEEQSDAAPLALIPLGVAPRYGPLLGPLPQTTTALARDGLSRFDAELFLDPALASLGIETLVEHADVVRFQDRAPRALFGIHAALSIGEGGLYNEATVLAIPDALHVGWQTPNEEKPPQAQTSGTSPPDVGSFLDCEARALTAPDLSGPPGTVPRGKFGLAWTASEPGATYALQEAKRRDLADAREIYRGSNLTFDVSAVREGIFYYRVNAVAGDKRGADSNVVAVRVRDDEWLQNPPSGFAAGGERELARIHRAALRLAAASGELFVVLGLPRHYRTLDAVSYANLLRAERSGLTAADADAFAFSERRALSYGALYHPWVLFGPSARMITDRVGRISAPAATAAARRVCPPDGIAAGVLASRALTRGAWIAPANEPFKDVVAVTPAIDVDAWLALQDAQINLIRADARGFLTLSADTLADELEWRPINVRRLLILLRRLALRRGASYVFEPHGDTLRRSVQRGFTLLLTDLFRRGAFAGNTATESFKVVTDATINTDVARDAGRFLVELRVAPSLPLQFLTVRLVQAGERLTVAEGT